MIFFKKQAELQNNMQIIFVAECSFKVEAKPEGNIKAYLLVDCGICIKESECN